MGKFIVGLLFLPVLAQAAELKPFEFEIPDSTEPAVCKFQGLRVPSDLVVYAAGAYSGRPLNFQIDDSGHVATQFDVVVNSPTTPVALMLGAYEPTIWNIGWSRGTEIIAVLASGNHRQAVTGLTEDVPIIVSSRDNGAVCGSFYINDEGNPSLNPIARRLFRKSVDLVYPGDKEGRIVVGDTLTSSAQLVTSSTSSPESFRDVNDPLAGLAGLEQAVERGLLRVATEEDARAWAAARALNSPRARDIPPIAGSGIPELKLPRLRNAYVVLQEFTYPAGLFGANSASFFIPEGVPMPTGNRGHSTIYIFETNQCFGVLCQVN